MKTCLPALALLAAPSLFSAQQPCGLAGVEVSVSPAVAALGEMVQVTVTNGSSQTILFATSCIFESVHAGGACSGALVFSPTCLFSLVPIDPGEFFAGFWYQNDNSSTQVAPGSYSFQVRYFDAGFTTQYTCCPTVTVTCAAAAQVRNGSLVNPSTLASVSPPRLGASWDTSLDCSAHAPSLAFLFVHDAPASGPLTPFGEILLGGALLYRTSRPHAGTVASFSAPIPSDLALCGLSSSAQGVCLGAPGARLSNALDLTLGF